MILRFPRYALVPVLSMFATGPSASNAPPVDLAVAPFTVEADSAGIMRAAADTCLDRLVAGLAAKGINVTRHPKLTEKTLGTAQPAPWALLGHFKRSKGEFSAELRIMEVATGDEMVAYMNSGKDVQAVIGLEKASPRIAAFIVERRPKSP